MDTTEDFERESLLEEAEGVLSCVQWAGGVTGKDTPAGRILDGIGLALTSGLNSGSRVLDATEVRARFTTSVHSALTRPTLKRTQLGIRAMKKLVAFGQGRSSLYMAVPYEVYEGRNVTIDIFVDTEDRTSQVQVMSDGCLQDAGYARSLGAALVAIADLAEEVETLCSTLLADLPGDPTDG